MRLNDGDTVAAAALVVEPEAEEDTNEGGDSPAGEQATGGKSGTKNAKPSAKKAAKD